MEEGFLRGSFGQKWKDVRLTSDLVLLGHSFGGITALGVAATCDEVKAVIALDPWFFSHMFDKIGCGDKKFMVVLTEHFCRDEEAKSGGRLHNDKELEKYV